MPAKSAAAAPTRSKTSTARAAAKSASPTRKAVAEPRQRAAAPRKAAAPARPVAEAPVFKFRMRVTAGDLVGVGPGKVALLEAMMRTGSITAAAKELDMSYRRAWSLVDELNRALSKPAVISATGGQRGGGSEVTPTGQRLVQLYRQIEAQALKACRADIAKLVRLIAT